MGKPEQADTRHNTMASLTVSMRKPARYYKNPSMFSHFNLDLESIHYAEKFTSLKTSIQVDPSVKTRPLKLISLAMGPEM